MLSGVSEPMKYSKLKKCKPHLLILLVGSISPGKIIWAQKSILIQSNSVFDLQNYPLNNPGKGKVCTYASRQWWTGGSLCFALELGCLWGEISGLSFCYFRLWWYLQESKKRETLCKECGYPGQWGLCEALLWGSLRGPGLPSHISGFCNRSGGRWGEFFFKRGHLKEPFYDLLHGKHLPEHIRFSTQTHKMPMCKTESSFFPFPKHIGRHTVHAFNCCLLKLSMWNCHSSIKIQLQIYISWIYKMNKMWFNKLWEQLSYL